MSVLTSIRIPIEYQTAIRFVLKRKIISYSVYTRLKNKLGFLDCLNLESIQLCKILLFRPLQKVISFGCVKDHTSLPITAKDTVFT